MIFKKNVKYVKYVPFVSELAGLGGVGDLGLAEDCEAEDDDKLPWILNGLKALSRGITLVAADESLPFIEEGFRFVGGVGSGDAGVGQVWSLTQFYSVDFSQSRIGGKEVRFQRTHIKVCVSCS